MPLVLADRVNETTTTTSTGTITLAGAVSGYQSFAVIGNGNTTYYTIVHQTANEWEVGIGTYTSSGTTIARNTVLASSNSGSLVNFSAGTKFVFCDYPAGRAVYLDTATNVTIPGLTLSGGTANGVLYLNGSKVATSGSALTFDGTYFTANGLRLAGTDVTNTIYQATGALGISTGSASGITFYTNLANRYQIDATGVAVWSVGGSESMRLTSTGLGIGTASPATRLDVAGAFGTGTTAFTITNTSAASASNIARIDFRLANSFLGNGPCAAVWGTNPNAAANNGGALVFGVSANGTSTTPSEVARFDQAGNLGIGTTSPLRKLSVAGDMQVYNTAADGASNTVIGRLTSQVRNYGTNIATSSFASIEFATGTWPTGNIRFLTNGTDGTDGAGTERMRLTAAGDLGLGTTSPANYANYRNLAISGTTGANIDMLSGSTKVGNLFNDATNFYAYNVIAGSLVFGTNNTERMRLDSAGRFLLGASSNTSRGGSNTTALFYKASGTQYLDIQTGTSGDSGIVFSATSSSAYGLINYSNSVNAMLFYANSAEVFRITSSGLFGLGTTSPTAKLHIVNSTPNSGRPTALFDANYGNTGDAVTGLRLNVNAGAGGGYQWGYSTEFVLAHNMEFISGSNYVARSTSASNLQQIGGSFIFFSNQSLTAGNTFTPTERMRLDSSGNLGIGTASPLNKLDVRAASDVIANYQTIQAFSTDSAAIDKGAGLALGGYYSGTSSIAMFGSLVGRKENSTAGNFSGYLAFGTNNNATGVTEKMRLDSSGNLGLGVTPSAWGSDYRAVELTAGAISSTTAGNTFMQVSNAAHYSGTQWIYKYTSIAPALYQQTLGQHRFLTAPSGTAGNAISFTQAMTLTSGGDLLVKKTSFGGTATGIDLGANGFVGSYSPDTTNATSTLAAYSNGASAYRFYVGWGGTVYATTTTITGISDQRLKENIRDLDSGLDAIMALKPRKFDWKEGKGKDIKNDRGFIAQEFEQVFPDLIDTWKDPAPEGEEPYKAVRADLIPVLVKAIQELKAELDALKGAK